MSAATMIKVCGLVDPTEMELLGATGVTHAGVWWEVPGSSRSLDTDGLRRMAVPGGPDGCLVTFSADVEGIADALAALGGSCVQLHAFQPPSAVAALRRRVPSTTRILKVLHVDRGRLLERPFVGAYTRAGVDAYVVDTIDGGRIGSTGVATDPGTLLAIGACLDRPFVVAGGVDASRAGELDAVRRHPGWHGIDVDSSARDEHGALDPARIDDLVAAWGAGSLVGAGAVPVAEPAA
ncbi:phosphoribosylanthranilate isomerase [Sanguibacter suaedae]|uniref:N-(5'-phosphoribosyl)anthranilate isomerase n=1 Tax=Sanguibacter suaedae TaxID=2795737 RepID=A0A934M7C9_9MICO|nr:hypothetical protein [Sanguibacter suaedae]MBI9115257.1 hypothetical protein [Sanguibacter suaedae]